MSNNIYYDYWKANKEKQDLQMWKDQTLFDIKYYIDTRLNELKTEIINSINDQVNIYATTFLNGKKTDLQDNITNYIIDEITKSFKK